MSYSNHSIAGSALRPRSTPWLVFLFLTVALFFVYHDLSYSKFGIGNYDAPEDAIASEVAAGSMSRRVALLSLGIFAIVTLIRHRSEGWPRITGSMGWLLAGFAALAFLSPIWAEDRGQTLTRVAVFGIFCLTAVAITRIFPLREIILWTFFATGSYALVALGVEAYFGTLRPLVSGYRFSGTLHPNSQGINCAILLLSSIAAGHLEKHRRTLYRIGTIGGLGLLVLTASRTAFAAALVTSAIYLGIVSTKRAKLAMVYASGVVFCFLLLVFGSAFVPKLTSAVMLGRDVDSSNGAFNGRTGIWDAIGDYVAQRPILGYGFEGFWTPSHINDISEEEKWGIPNSHDAYLDYLLTLGAVGLTTYVLLLFSGIKRAFHFHKLSHNSAYAFCAMLLMFCTLEGLLESAIADPSLPMLLTLVVLLYLAVRDDSQVQRFSRFPTGAAFQPSRS